MYKRIILASRSPRRIELLKQIRVDCHAMPTDIDESIKPNESPANYVKRLAKEKAEAAHLIRKPEYANMLILAADTTVAINDEILGKPESDEDAIKMLKKLSGTTHYVHTAVAAFSNNKMRCMLNSSIVEMMVLSDQAIKDYIASGEHRDKAGSYGIQGLAGAWIKQIEGSYSGVMGLPLYETAQLLNKMRK
jgi:septum formation protein